ncbi:MAG: polysaccharide biosynthesis protein, partial [Prevotellaceae bacterium]|nr:polysaccharide biosynthesis protein [Prevotellaceae bacterium]
MIETFLRGMYKRFWENRLFDKNVILFIDCGLMLIASLAAFFLTEQIYHSFFLSYQPVLWIYMAVSAAFNLLLFLLLGTYKGVIRYSTIREFGRLQSALIIANILVFCLLHWVLQAPGSVSGVYTALSLLMSLVGLYGFRILSVYIYQRLTKHYGEHLKIPVFLWGLTEDNILLTQVLSVGHSKFAVAGFLTTQRKSKFKKMTDLPVFEIDTPQDLGKYDIIDVLFSNENDLKENSIFVEKLLSIKRQIYIMQETSIKNMSQLAGIGRNIRSLKIEDLLGRTEIKINLGAIEENIRNKTVLVTGAAGSIGSEIVRQIAKFAPKFVICLDQAETPLHDLHLELKEKYPILNYRVIIADIRNPVKMAHEFNKHKPDIVYHAAAYKHVPMMERFPCEAVVDNVLGTKVLVDLAVKNKVEMFVMISTDKAVNPTSIMGATKRIAEIYVQTTATDSAINISRTKFVTTRFGNVLGSNGSVIPLFRSQIEKGGPLTVTHPDITRFFMTIPEACRLVLEASVIGKSGYIYVFDMGKPV